MQAHPGAVGLLAAHRRPQSAKRRKADGVGFGEADEDFGEVFGATDGAGADERLRRHRDVHQRPLAEPAARRAPAGACCVAGRSPAAPGCWRRGRRRAPRRWLRAAPGRRCWSRWTAPAGDVADLGGHCLCVPSPPSTAISATPRSTMRRAARRVSSTLWRSGMSRNSRNGQWPSRAWRVWLARSTAAAMPVMSGGSNAWRMPVAPKAASRRCTTDALSVLECSPAWAVRRRRSRPEAGLAMMPTIGEGGVIARIRRRRRWPGR